MDRETFLEELFSLDAGELERGLPTRLQEAVNADPGLAAEVAALKTMDQVLPAMGRIEVDESFFLRQRKAVMAEVVPLSRPQKVEVWNAPAGSLVALLGIIGSYACAGIEGGLLGSMDIGSSLTTGPDPMNSFLVVYGCLLALALYVFYLDSHPSRGPATVPVRG
jgi:hypothetical protein